MANTYCTATNTGKGFFTHDDRNDFYLSGHAGDVWVVGNNAAGVSWINRVSGTAKVKADAQAIVDAKMEEAGVAWDAESAEYKANYSRPVKYILPQELTMATYKGIKGVKVQSKASDPTASEADGTVWYNTTSSALKYAIQGGGAWASGGSMTRVGSTDVRMSGTQTATLMAGGYAPAPTLVEVWTEKYDGSTWTEVADLNQARYNGFMAGTQTASVFAGGVGPGGVNQALSETWDGTSWTEGNNMPTARAGGGQAGTQSSMIAIGGHGPVNGACFIYDGSCWTTSPASLGTARHQGGGGGASSTSAIYAGGTPGYQAVSETWNGSVWTEGNNLNVARYSMTGFGIVTEALVCAGYKASGSPRDANETETYDGTSWSTGNVMGTARYGLGGAGGPGGISSGIIGGGNGDSGLSKLVEEWNDPAYVIKTVTVS